MLAGRVCFCTPLPPLSPTGPFRAGSDPLEERELEREDLGESKEEFYKDDADLYPVGYPRTTEEIEYNDDGHGPGNWEDGPCAKLDGMETPRSYDQETERSSRWSRPGMSTSARSRRQPSRWNARSLPRPGRPRRRSGMTSRQRWMPRPRPPRSRSSGSPRPRRRPRRPRSGTTGRRGDGEATCSRHGHPRHSHRTMFRAPLPAPDHPAHPRKLHVTRSA